MDISVINLGSSFDWRGSVEDILRPLTGEEIADALGVPEESQKISERLSKLRWVGLVSEEFMSVQTSSSEYGEGKSYTNRWHGGAFEIRMGGSEDSKFYMRPRKAVGGGVIESYGMYCADIRAFAAGAYMKPVAVRYTAEDYASLDAALPENIGNEPMILLCPERIFELPVELVKALRAGEPRPNARYSEISLQMSVLHQLGHHILPGKWDDDSTIHIWEMLSDHLCSSLLGEYERRWMFARSWLLQSSPNLSFFVPGLIEAACHSELGEWMKGYVKSALDGSSGTQPLSGIISDDKLGSKLMVSPQMILAIEGVGKSLGDAGLVGLAASALPCAIGPLEEVEMPWRTPIAMGSLLSSSQPTLQLAAMDALDAIRARGEEIPSEISALMAKWVDENLLSESRAIALRAWNCAEMHRKEGLAERYARAAKSKLSMIYLEVPQKIRLNLPETSKALLGELMEKGASADLRYSAAVQLALLYADNRENENLVQMLMAADTVRFGKIWDGLAASGYPFDLWSLVRLIADGCPQIVGRHLGDEHIKRQETARDVLRQKMISLVTEMIQSMSDLDVPGDIDFATLATASSQSKDTAALLSQILLRMEDRQSLRFLSMMIMHGGSNGDAASVSAIEAHKTRDKDLLVCAASVDAVNSLRALIENGVEVSWLEEAFSTASENWRVRAGYEIAKAGSSQGEEWLSSRYSETLTKGADVARSAKYLGYLAYLSIVNKWSENVQILLKAGADAKIRESSTGNTLLHAAANAGDRASVEVLIEKGIAPSTKNASGSTPLHLAAEQGHAEIISILCKGADVFLLDGGDGSGRTALILAASKGHLEAVKALMAAGASPRVGDKDRKNAGQRAAEAGHMEVARFIFDYMAGR